MRRRRGEKSRKLRTARPRSLRAVHWVFCEGETEAKCLRDLNAHWKGLKLRPEELNHGGLKADGSQGVPMTIVKRAKQKRAELDKKRLPKPPTVHVVFDRDEHPRFKEAIAQAKAAGLSLGISVPCFELWGLLLHMDQTAPIHRHKAQRKLKDVHLGYDHKKHPYLDSDVVLDNLDVAAERSKRLAKRAQDAGDPYANPISTFSDVIEQIRASLPG